MAGRVFITGTGLVTSLGYSSGELQAALCAGRNGIRPVTRFDTGGLACQLGGEISSFSAKDHLGNANTRALDRTSQLVATAAGLVLDNSGWSVQMREDQQVGLVLGTMFCSVHTISEFDRRAVTAGPSYASPMDFANTVINAAAGQTAIWHKLRGVNSTIATGVTSGLHAIGYAADLIATGRATAIIAGGADELCFESFVGFNRAELLCGSNHLAGDFPIPFDSRRNGFALGEGAALLMLEDGESALARGAHVLGEIKGYGSAYDCSQGRSDDRSIEAIGRSIRRALDEALMSPDEIGCLSASANGSVDGDRREAIGTASALGRRAAQLPVTAIKSMLGETLGASGAIQAIALIQSIREGLLPGIPQLETPDAGNPLKMLGREAREIGCGTGLVNSMGFDGNCCSVVIAAAQPI